MCSFLGPATIVKSEFRLFLCAESNGVDRASDRHYQCRLIYFVGFHDESLSDLSPSSYLLIYSPTLVARCLLFHQNFLSHFSFGFPSIVRMYVSCSFRSTNSYSFCSFHPCCLGVFPLSPFYVPHLSSFVFPVAPRRSTHDSTNQRNAHMYVCRSTSRWR